MKIPEISRAYSPLESECLIPDQIAGNADMLRIRAWLHTNIKKKGHHCPVASASERVSI